jgi:hypothetical protein
LFRNISTDPSNPQWLVFRDSSSEEMDGLGEESRLGVVWSGKISHAERCPEFPRDTQRFNRFKIFVIIA